MSGKLAVAPVGGQCSYIVVLLPARVPGALGKAGQPASGRREI